MTLGRPRCFLILHNTDLLTPNTMQVLSQICRLVFSVECKQRNSVLVRDVNSSEYAFPVQQCYRKSNWKIAKQKYSRSTVINKLCNGNLYQGLARFRWQCFMFVVLFQNLLDSSALQLSHPETDKNSSGDEIANVNFFLQHRTCRGQRLRPLNEFVISTKHLRYLRYLPTHQTDF